MGIRFRKRVGGKNAWLNITKNGVSSVSTKITKNITHNTNRGVTVNLGNGVYWQQSKSSSKETPTSLLVISCAILAGLFWFIFM